MYRLTNNWHRVPKHKLPGKAKGWKKIRLGLLTITPGKSVTLSGELFEKFRDRIEEYQQLGLVVVETVGTEAPKKETSRKETSEVEAPKTEASKAEAAKEEPEKEPPKEESGKDSGRSKSKSRKSGRKSKK